MHLNEGILKAIKPSHHVAETKRQLQPVNKHFYLYELNVHKTPAVFSVILRLTLLLLFVKAVR